jgi:hypothetical protein
MPKEFSDTNKAGRKYARMGKPDKKAEHRTPRRDKQVARGVGFAQHAQKEVARAREDMGRRRWGGK